MIFLYCLLLSSVIWTTSNDRGRLPAKKVRDEMVVKSGILERKLLVSEKSALTSSLSVNGIELLAEEAEEFSVTIWKAFPDEMPRGICYESNPGIIQKDDEKNQTDALKVEKNTTGNLQTIAWIDSVKVTGKPGERFFNRVKYSSDSSDSHKSKLMITFIGSGKPEDNEMTVKVIYESYKGFPVIRKWLKFENTGTHWMKIGNLSIDQFHFRESFSTTVPLTPEGRGTDSAILAFTDPAASEGVVAVSEIPSRVRELSSDGKLGYDRDYFEWVLGPGESFETEPVFVYAFSGKSYNTVSAGSTALDRCVENEFRRFLNENILCSQGDPGEIAPVFCSWTNYHAAINDSNMRVAAGLASLIGFRCFQLDAGWSETGTNNGWAVSSPCPDLMKFSDLKGLSGFIHSKNMRTGLWYSVFTKEQDEGDPGDHPVLFSVPPVRRTGGLGLSMCFEKSRDKYINDVLSLHYNYNADYFKQDLSCVCYGDIAEGHESRTLKESYLRGLRGLFATQDEIKRRAPDVWLQLSHEIYWETPGPPADVAVLKHADSYHISPNEYWGAGNRSRLVSADWKYDVDSLRQQLIRGAFRSREFLYAHRGLPLDRIEVFGAVTTNFRSSLIPEIQERQVCSWLMGAPISFSGDLGSLSEENIEHYRELFSMVDKLQQKYGIYSCFQFSGVPSPTDSGWHWWGKINENGSGAVVVLRGNEGGDLRKVNIPWVRKDKNYRLKALLKGNDLGAFSGELLQLGELEIRLPPWGQEIIEIEQF